MFNLQYCSLQSRFRSREGPTGDELIVVTLLVASEGDLKVPNISSQEQLRSALNRLGGLRSDQVCTALIFASRFLIPSALCLRRPCVELRCNASA